MNYRRPELAGCEARSRKRFQVSHFLPDQQVERRGKRNSTGQEGVLKEVPGPELFAGLTPLERWALVPQPQCGQVKHGVNIVATR